MKQRFFLIAAAVLVAIAGIILLCCLPKDSKTPTPAATEPTPSAASSAPTVATNIQDTSINLGYDLYMTQVGSYTGPFLEDGSDEIVSGVLMIRVENRSDRAVEYATISLQVTEGTATFAASCLLPGETIVLLEKNRLPWRSTEDYLYPLLDVPAYYTHDLSLHSDKLSLQLQEGSIQVVNTSGEDLAGEIVLYFKNKQQGIYYGGITYRLRMENGLKAGASCQLLSSHLHQSSTEILFVTMD